jgi:autoinducer 2-degrading protein
MYVVCVTSWVKPDHLEEYMDACRANAAATRKEPGNLRFDFLQGADNPHRFFFYEVYKTEEDFHAHHKTAHYLEWRDKVSLWMEKPREGVKYNSLLPPKATDW